MLSANKSTREKTTMKLSSGSRSLDERIKEHLIAVQAPVELFVNVYGDVICRFSDKYRWEFKPVTVEDGYERGIKCVTSGIEISWESI